MLLILCVSQQLLCLTKLCDILTVHHAMYYMKEAGGDAPLVTESLILCLPSYVQCIIRPVLL
jgi:hypothetical protein